MKFVILLLSVVRHRNGLQDSTCGIAEAKASVFSLSVNNFLDIDFSARRQELLVTNVVAGSGWNVARVLVSHNCWRTTGRVLFPIDGSRRSTQACVTVANSLSLSLSLHNSTIDLLLLRYAEGLAVQPGWSVQQFVTFGQRYFTSSSNNNRCAPDAIASLAATVTSCQTV